MADISLSLNLAVTAGAALAGGVAARLLHQSVLVGYIAAGVVLSPFTPGPVADLETIERLADLGVVLLMFTVGVHFSLRDLLRVRVAAFGAALQLPLSITVVAVATMLAGWTWREGVFFGAAAALAGSTVLTKLLSERGEEGSLHGRMAIGWSVAQDLATVVLVVVLGVIAEGGADVAVSLGVALLKAAAFLGVMIAGGSRLMPWLLGHVARLGSRELFILAIAGLAIGTALLAEQTGLSLALGAFIAGVVLSESDLSYHALGEMLPLREIFAALFFVSVGMLVNPSLILEHLPLFLMLVLAVLSKGWITAQITTILRYPRPVAALIGIAVAPSAEFSFILVRQGATAGVVSGTTFSLMLAATVASIFLAPVLYRLAPLLERTIIAVPGRAPFHLLLPDQPDLPELRNHVVICGGGRVGGLIAGVLRTRRQRFVMIEMDRRLAEGLRRAGNTVIYGNAAAAPVLEQAHLAAARTLVIALPDPVATRQIVDWARRHSPRLDIVARVDSVEAAALLRELGVNEAVVAEQELALEMTRHTLHRIGIPSMEIQSIVQYLRFGSARPRDDGTPTAQAPVAVQPSRPVIPANQADERPVARAPRIRPPRRPDATPSPEPPPAEQQEEV